MDKLQELETRIARLEGNNNPPEDVGRFKEIVRKVYPEANARNYIGMGWYVISKRGAFSLERDGWLGSGSTEERAWENAAKEVA